MLHVSPHRGEAVLHYPREPLYRVYFYESQYYRVFAELGGLRVRFVSDQQLTNRGFVANFFISRQSRPFLVSA